MGKNQQPKENEINFKVYTDKKEYDKLFEEIKQIPADLSPKEIISIIQKKFTLGILLNTVVEKSLLETFTYFRVRPLKQDEPIDEKLIDSFSYPPIPDKIKMGRANLKGQQVFYAAGDPHTPFHELADDITLGSTVVYLSKWGIRDHPGSVLMRSLFFGLPEGDNKDYASIMSSSINKKFVDFFSNMPDNIKENFAYGQKRYNEIFTTKGKYFYHITSAIANHTFVEAAKQNINIPIITYPSVAKNNTAVNFALRKDFVDKYLYLKEVDKVIVTKWNEESIDIAPISRGIVKDGQIEWLQIKVHIDKVDYENAQIYFSNVPDIRLLKANEKLTRCCAKHVFTVKKFLDESKVNDALILQAMKGMPHTMFDLKLSQKTDYIFLAQPEGDLFVDSNISEAGKVAYIGLPVTYHISYEL